MKKIFLVAIAIASLVSCSETKKNRLISPLPAGVSVDSLIDCTVPASFSADDFNWRDSSLTFTVYNEDLYDVVDISQMAIGDTILYDGNKIKIDSIERKGEFIIINSGIEDGGADLQAYEGGTYRAIQHDDHFIYTELGTAKLAISNDLEIIDCGEQYTDPYDTIRTEPKIYLDGVKEYKRNFCPLNTKVLIENGVIVGITRRWIP